MKSGWEVAWDVIKTILMICSLAFIVMFIVSLFATDKAIGSNTKKQINGESGKNGKNRFF